MNLWLDDMRPAPVGWFHAKTIDEAKDVLMSGRVEHASLDHDLGACPDCMGGMSPEEWLQRSNYMSMPHCEHFGDGSALVRWMAETGNWPTHKPTVHSANPVGRDYMVGVIDRYFSGGKP